MTGPDLTQSPAYPELCRRLLEDPDFVPDTTPAGMKTLLGPVMVDGFRFDGSSHQGHRLTGTWARTDEGWKPATLAVIVEALDAALEEPLLIAEHHEEWAAYELQRAESKGTRALVPKRGAPRVTFTHRADREEWEKRDAEHEPARGR